MLVLLLAAVHHNIVDFAAVHHNTVAVVDYHSIVTDRFVRRHPLRIAA